MQQVLAAGSVALTEREQGHATGHQVLLVQGPPGTGKTSTIACLLGLLVSGGGALSSLLVAPTNTAVQEVRRAVVLIWTLLPLLLVWGPRVACHTG